MTAPAATPRSLKDRLTDPANRLGLVASLLLAASAGFAVLRAVPVVNAIRAGTATGAGADGKDAEAATTLFTAALARDTSQVNGRSFFFDPSPPPPPPPPPDNRPPPPPPPPPSAPPPPSSYGGPKVVGTAFDTVWFDNNKTMRVGGPLESEMRIISISTAPYVVRIEWKGVEFDVPFLLRDATIVKGRPGTAAPEPTPEPAAPEPAPSAPPTPATPAAPKPIPTETPSPTPAPAPSPAGEPGGEVPPPAPPTGEPAPTPPEKPDDPR